jgi:hypothetical protein
MGFFSFRKTFDNIGVGTKDLGLLPRTTPPPGGSYLGPQWNVKRSMKPFSNPGVMLMGKTLVMPNSLRGNGMAIPGQFAMTPLAQASKQGN